MNLRRLGAALLLTGLALAGTATPALAHAELLSSDPGAGAALSAAPTQIQLTFAEPVGLPDTPITVTGPDGATWKVGQVTVAGAVITAPVIPSGPSGEYVIDYKVISDDGDEVGDKIRFSLIAPVALPTSSAANTSTPEDTTATTTTTATSTPAAAQPADTPSDDDSGVPVWVWILAAVVLIGAGAFGATRLGKSKPDPTTTTDTKPE
ncbi:copper resistance protein CopC [Umezawaea sp. Da 62-37]|uniref:copper resistance CopC family protein n=1 Tax=Umezawaea sp. Da 62-37 TaxID=3075927 RepID=UPI0028F72139|nr:copper resistance protein CopC [Umezawaea sp. Da 62-37]WNV88524.1 copper resistance protein CopC [Umezawaea sp. Da 62-37]